MRVLTWHDGMGIDAYPDREEVEHVIAVRVHNLGERAEHVVEMGLQSPSGSQIADDRPADVKLIDEPPPEGRELPPRGQIPANFKVSADAIVEGFVAYAVLGTGDRAYSDIALRNPGFGDIEEIVRGTITEAKSRRDVVDQDGQ